MKNECQIRTIRGPKTTSVEISGPPSAVHCAMIATMTVLLRKEAATPHDLFCMVASAVLDASDE